MHRNAVNGAKQSAAELPPLSTITTPPLQRAAAAFDEPESMTPDKGEVPIPDYEEKFQRRKSFDFVNNFQNVIYNIRTIDELYTCFPEPDPDYTNDDEDSVDPTSSDFPPPPSFTAEELSAAVSEAYDIHISNGSSMTLDETYAGSSDPPPLIKPKPLHNPCLDSKERMALHRELLMNYKIGKDVLQKPELKKVMRDRKEKEKKKEWEELKSSKGRTSLVIKLEERATKLKEEEEKQTKVATEEAEAPELARIHRKITQKSGNS